MSTELEQQTTTAALPTPIPQEQLQQVEGVSSTDGTSCGVDASSSPSVFLRSAVASSSVTTTATSMPSSPSTTDNNNQICSTESSVGTGTGTGMVATSQHNTANPAQVAGAATGDDPLLFFCRHLLCQARFRGSWGEKNRRQHERLVRHDCPSTCVLCRDFPASNVRFAATLNAANPSALSQSTNTVPPTSSEGSSSADKKTRRKASTRHFCRFCTKEFNKGYNARRHERTCPDRPRETPYLPGPGVPPIFFHPLGEPSYTHMPHPQPQPHPQQLNQASSLLYNNPQAATAAAALFNATPPLHHHLSQLSSAFAPSPAMATSLGLPNNANALQQPLRSSQPTLYNFGGSNDSAGSSRPLPTSTPTTPPVQSKGAPFLSEVDERALRELQQYYGRSEISEELVRLASLLARRASGVEYF